MEFESYLHSVLQSGINLEEKFDIVYKILQEIGVEKKEHCKYVNASDFGSSLTKIQARMLVEKFKCKYSLNGYLNLLLSSKILNV